MSTRLLLIRQCVALFQCSTRRAWVRVENVHGVSSSNCVLRIVLSKSISLSITFHSSFERPSVVASAVIVVLVVVAPSMLALESKLAVAVADAVAVIVDATDDAVVMVAADELTFIDLSASAPAPLVAADDDDHDDNDVVC